MIYKLREDYKKEKADLNSLKEVYNELLGYGFPPITILRKMMVEDYFKSNHRVALKH